MRTALAIFRRSLACKTSRTRPTLGDKLAGSPLENPHSMYATPAFGSGRPGDYGRELGESDGVAGIDGAYLTTSGARSFRRRSDAPPLAGRINFGLAYDAGRGRLVLFGGCISDCLNDLADSHVWEWNGATWSRSRRAIQRATVVPWPARVP